MDEWRRRGLYQASIQVNSARRAAVLVLKLRRSMSGKGGCWDDAPMESVNGTVKVECVNDETFETHRQAEAELVDYFGYYNTERPHSSLGYVSPSEFERRWRAENDTNAASVP